MLGYDAVRQAMPVKKDIKLTRFEEAYTTDHWLLRIYRLLPEPELDPPMEARKHEKGVSVPMVKKLEKPSF
jgi:dolichyl-diphosphooligosaccharide--protein glycosyltransferase